jgi:hypothetical protein
MKTYEPLTPPEIQRDDATGRFARKGLAKVAKFRQEQPGRPLPLVRTKRRPGGTPFQPGVSGNPAGKPKGTPNKITVALREAILAAGEAAGGEGGLTAYLTRLALENSSAYAGLLAKVLPTTLSTPESGGGAGVQVVFRREIVWPGGRTEIDGVTPPKALPPPDAHALPRPTDPTDDTKGAV